MKTLFMISIAALFSFATFANDNNEELLANSDVKAQYKIVNVLLKEEVGKAKVAILDVNGKRLYQRNVNTSDSDLVIPYNMENMPTGEYRVMISTENAQVDYKVNTFNRAIPADELPLKAHGQILNDNTIKLAVFGLLEPGVDVKIRYEDSHRIMHRETINTPNAFSKNFKIKGVDPSEVYFELKDAKGRTRIIHI